MKPISIALAAAATFTGVQACDWKTLCYCTDSLGAAVPDATQKVCDYENSLAAPDDPNAFKMITDSDGIAKCQTTGDTWQFWSCDFTKECGTGSSGCT
ncbi:hypothetical protein LX32DRAFT_688587 [Colletotrichum zoysiae]|uniref:Uncharacterized protein n=1 Tax=Colletotrichum zoysiae TaxID=1216348 RepID=A0AAD9HVF9_9PEZI|nr:hypothetical protein LX32DRAFT_688587 [Colletotrichum zoysiae]